MWADKPTTSGQDCYTNQRLRQMTEMNDNKLKKDVIEMLEKVTRPLEECRRAHQNTRFDEDLKLILNDAYIALILFWADTVSFMRAYPNGMSCLNHKTRWLTGFTGTDEQGTPYDYEREIKKVTGTFDHLKVCATSMPESGPNPSVVPSDVPLRSLLPKDLSLLLGGSPTSLGSSWWWIRHKVAVGLSSGTTLRHTCLLRNISRI